MNTRVTKAACESALTWLIGAAMQPGGARRYANRTLPSVDEYPEPYNQILRFVLRAGAETVTTSSVIAALGFDDGDRGTSIVRTAWKAGQQPHGVEEVRSWCDVLTTWWQDDQTERALRKALQDTEKHGSGYARPRLTSSLARIDKSRRSMRPPEYSEQRQYHTLKREGGAVQRTGSSYLDWLTGGIVANETVTLAGLQGGYKTRHAMSMLLPALLRGVNVVYFPLESGAEEWDWQARCMLANDILKRRGRPELAVLYYAMVKAAKATEDRPEHEQAVRLTNEQEDALILASEMIADAPGRLELYDELSCPNPRLADFQLEAAWACAAEYGLTALCIDNGDRQVYTDSTGKPVRLGANEWVAKSAYAGDFLQDIATSPFPVFGLMLWQLTKDRTGPMGGIGLLSKTTVYMEQIADRDTPGKIDISVHKARHYPTGYATEATLWFQAHDGRHEYTHIRTDNRNIYNSLIPPETVERFGLPKKGSQS